MATFDTVADADASLAHLKARQFTACLQKYYNNHDKVSKNGVTYTNTSTNKRISVPSIGDTTLGFENEVTGSARGHSSTAYSEVEDVQVGRTVLSFNFTGGGPSLLTNQQALVQSVVNRVRRAASATSALNRHATPPLACRASAADMASSGAYASAMSQRRFEVVCEIEPPTRPDLMHVRHQIGVLSRIASGFLIPDSHIGRATISSVAVAHEVELMGGRADRVLNAAIAIFSASAAIS